MTMTVTIIMLMRNSDTARDSRRYHGSRMMMTMINPTTRMPSLPIISRPRSASAASNPFTYDKHVTWWDGSRRSFEQITCPACLDAKEQKRRLEQKREDFQWVMFHQYRDSDRGSRLGPASFDQFEERPHNGQALTLAKAWLQEARRPNLIIVGPVGSGKSYLAACLYRALVDQYEQTYWVNAGTLMAQIRRGFSSRDAAYEAGSRAEKAQTAPFLVLDDLGKVHPGRDVSWVEETFYAIIEARYRNQLPTVVTTEWKTDALAERVGVSVVSRLEAGAWVIGLRKSATSYRRTARRCHPSPATPETPKKRVVARTDLTRSHRRA
jgi:DNA replication protein DnaC